MIVKKKKLKNLKKMEPFDPYKRTVEPNWLIAQIESLLFGFKHFQNPSYIIYACLEARNLIERVEHELLEIAAKDSNNEDFLKVVKMKNGLTNANKKFNALKYKYQSFSKIATEVLFSNLNLKTYNYKDAENLKYELSQYLHIHTRENSDMDVNSEFILNGFHLVEKTILFIKEYFTEIRPGEVVYGLFDFKTLKPDVMKVFDDWVKDGKSDENDLRDKLTKINLANNGLKTNIAI